MSDTRAVFVTFLLSMAACSQPRPKAEEPRPDSVGTDMPGAAQGSADRPDGAGVQIPQSLEHKAGTYDPRHDPAPSAGPGAPRVGDVPGTGLSPIDSPIAAPPPSTPSLPPVDQTPTTPR